MLPSNETRDETYADTCYDGLREQEICTARQSIHTLIASQEERTRRPRARDVQQPTQTECLHLRFRLEPLVAGLFPQLLRALRQDNGRTRLYHENDGSNEANARRTT